MTATLAYLPAEWLQASVALAFFVALGAIVGSFLNVLVYRMPNGISVVSPPSACPKCETRLTWRENIPVLGWILLGGKCRFCKGRVSIEYPIVEAVVALLFGGVWALWFMRPSVFLLIGIEPRDWEPAWAALPPMQVVPLIIMVLVMLSCLVAITLIDARTFTIPLELPWIATGVAFIAHPLNALMLSDHAQSRLAVDGWRWAIPDATGPWLGLAVGGGLGILLSSLLVWRGVISRSFADADEWEANAEAAEAAAREEAAQQGTSVESQDDGEPDLKALLVRTALLTAPAIAMMFLGFALGYELGAPREGMVVGMLLGLVVGVVLRNRAVSATDDEGGPEAGLPLWAHYPHARREMLREIAFLAPAAVLGLAGYLIADGAVFAADPPLWVRAIGGSLLGYLIGGGVVWAVRILGTLGFGKEAMGLGDVHLMAAIGACLGWINPTIAFFVAPFLAIGWAVVAAILSRWKANPPSLVLPYGPYLCVAAVLVMTLDPIVEQLLTELLGRPILLP